MCFNCIDFEGKELGCGLYCDNQWGRQEDEQYYFIPLKYEKTGENIFKLYRDETRAIQTNKDAPIDWVENDEKINKLLDELCNENGWMMDMTKSQVLFWVLTRWTFFNLDDPTKYLYDDQ